MLMLRLCREPMLACRRGVVGMFRIGEPCPLPRPPFSFLLLFSPICTVSAVSAVGCTTSAAASSCSLVPSEEEVPRTTPFSRRKHRSVAWPSVTSTSPWRSGAVRRLLASLQRSSLSSRRRVGTSSSQATRCSSCTLLASACTSRKVSRASDQTTQGSAARTEADLGALYSSASSPTASPALSMRIRFPSMVISIVPLWITYIFDPSSPWRIRYSPASTTSSRIESSTRSIRSKTSSPIKKKFRSPPTTRFLNSSRLMPRVLCPRFTGAIFFCCGLMPFS
mmetsp:Transcript_6643/g.11756  ORF Transcript_6643/g.11756 Transcript_6643/m.11756 type:complete len:280 (+) Transcript_6643:364-1203(+)